MDDAQQDTVSTAERRALIRAGRLNAVHWLVLAASLLLTIFAWRYSQSQVEEKNRVQFDRQTSQLVALIEERMQKYEQGLQAGVAAIHMLDDKPTRKEWRILSESLKLEERYPGINGIGVIEHVLPSDLDAHIAGYRSQNPDYRVHPEHEEQEHYPIVFIEPETTNAAAIGLDMAHESNRYKAARQARKTGTAHITGPIYLVQETGRSPGFLFFKPFYRKSIDRQHTEDDGTFLGIVYAPFVVEKLIAGTLDRSVRNVIFRVSDNDEVLFDELDMLDKRYDPDPLFTSRVDMKLYGRTWSFDIQSDSAFRNSAQDDQPMMVLATGILIDVLLLGMFTMMARANRRALEIADQMTVAHRLKNLALERSNEDLERFASIASHDLRTPLRGIANLSEYIEEDLEEYLSSPSAKPDVAHNLGRLRERAGYMDRLITDILAYSSVGSTPEKMADFSLREFAADLRTTFNLAPEQLLVTGYVTSVYADTTRLSQVLTNLVSNAVKHHDGNEPLKIVLNAEREDDNYLITVKDNGPGIDARFHSKIFDMFETLSETPKASSTGIGLSIVRKATESVGGSIAIAPGTGQGTIFKIVWPMSAPAHG